MNENDARRIEDILEFATELEQCVYPEPAGALEKSTGKVSNSTAVDYDLRIGTTCF